MPVEGGGGEEEVEVSGFENGALALVRQKHGL